MPFLTPQPRQILPYKSAAIKKIRNYYSDEDSTSKNHRTAWVGRDLKVQPPAMDRDTFH